MKRIRFIIKNVEAVQKYINNDEIKLSEGNLEKFNSYLQIQNLMELIPTSYESSDLEEFYNKTGLKAIHWKCEDKYSCKYCDRFSEMSSSYLQPKENEDIEIIEDDDDWDIEEYSSQIHDYIYCLKGIEKNKSIDIKITKQKIEKLAYEVLDMFYDDGADDVEVFFNNKCVSKIKNLDTDTIEKICNVNRTPYKEVYCPSKHILTIRSEKIFDIFNGWNNIFKKFMTLISKYNLGASMYFSNDCSLYPVDMNYDNIKYLDYSRGKRTEKRVIDMWSMPVDTYEAYRQFSNICYTCRINKEEKSQGDRTIIAFKYKELYFNLYSNYLTNSGLKKEINKVTDLLREIGCSNIRFYNEYWY
ncbi:hypothetical protein K0040_15540 [Terrisporobacter petrolearius]|uniref:hypothetical protein n=1 Tax=Terrisporobacter petrolearius TaxID=1460447 RepID=UPI001D16BF0F|nr:hypothetical protein [Terrisporobacter petrolearius]MCC3865676.1 hypothetical protein [Terrisporobacter petrolearius]